MNVVMCKNKHYFDADTYDACPHCGAQREDKTSETEMNVAAKQKKGWFRKPKPDENIPKEPKPSIADGNALSYEPKIQHSLSTEDVTVPVWDNPANEQDNRFQNLGDTPSAEAVNEVKTDVTVPVTESIVQPSAQPVVQPVAQPSAQSVAQSAAEPADGGSELRDAIRKASANPDGKTLGFFKMSVQRNEDMREIGGVEGSEQGTAAAPARTINAEPPAGWLVCIKGPHFGECFNIASGRNSIGRYASNSIVIERDNGVSREKHAWVTYEPKKRDFFIKPGEGSGLTYLNDEMIEESHKLEKMDKIEIGETLLMFVPLCGDDFSWENLN